jgi:hypothetical protein
MESGPGLGPAAADALIEFDFYFKVIWTQFPNSTLIWKRKIEFGCRVNVPNETKSLNRISH